MYGVPVQSTCARRVVSPEADTDAQGTWVFDPAINSDCVAGSQFTGDS